jgi:hypothetical protein
MAIWNISWRFGVFYDHVVQFGFIWYIFPVWVPCTKKNLATLTNGIHIPMYTASISLMYCAVKQAKK